MTTGLLRSNPKLTGNVKISVSSSGELFLNSIDANKDLSDDRFKRVRINHTKKLSSDLYRFFDGGNLPSSIVYDVLKTTDDITSKSDFSKHFEQQYNYGTSRCDSGLFDEAYCMLAPIWLTKDIPNFFIIFRNPGARAIEYDRNPDKLQIGIRYTVFGDENFSVRYGGSSFISGQSFITDAINGDGYTIIGDNGYVVLDDPDFEFQSIADPDNFIKNFVSPSQIVKVFDLREGTKLGDYLRNHVNDPLFSTRSIGVNFEGDELVYNGIDLTTGVISQAVESLDTITEQELDMLDFDEFITQGFERHKLISSNLLNMEFMFDDKKSDLYSFNRYFGFYCNTEDIGSFFVDKPKMFSKQGLYRNIYYDKDVLPRYYGKKIIDEDGVKIIPDEITQVDGYIFRKPDIEQKETFYYLRDKRGGLHKFNNLNTTDHYSLVDTEIDSELLFGLNDTHFELPTKKFTEGGRSSMVLEINEQLQTGFRIQFLQSGNSIGFIVADHLPNVTPEELQLLEDGAYSGDPDTPYQEGESVEHYFYPTGTPEQIAQGMATAIDWLLRGKKIDATAIGNRVFLRAKFTGAEYNEFRIDIPDDEEKVTFDNDRMTGGTTTSISRVRIDKDFPQQITEKSFVALEGGGFARIQSISSYLEEPVFEEGEVVSFRNVDSYRIVTIVDENKEIKVEKGDIFVFNERQLQMGVLSFYNLKDFDYDTFTTTYAKAYTNEYKKYFKTAKDKLEIGEIYVVHKLDVDPTKAFVEHDGVQHTNTGYDIINFFSIPERIVIDGDHVSEFQSGLVVIRGSESNNAVFTVSSVNLVGGDTEIEVVESIPEPIDISGRVHAAFEAVTEDFEIVGGNPIVINQKYYDDDELKRFVGFSALNTGEVSNINTINIDTDDLKNKFALLSFDETRVEYNRLKENLKSASALKSRIVPIINKWVLEGGNNIRDVEYRLNSSEAFGQLNFSPSFIDEDQNPISFTHEWLYLGAIPENISDQDLFKSTAYFNNKFDIDKYKNQINDYFSNFFTVDEYIRRLPISESIAQSEKWTLTGIIGGDIALMINGIIYSEPHDTSPQNTVTNWVTTHETTIESLGIDVVDDTLGGITFTAQEPGIPFYISPLEAGTDGLWTQSDVTESVGNRLLEVPTTRRYTTFRQISEQNYQTFFRGARIKLLSESIDYTGYKFSAVLNFRKTEFLEKQPPFQIEIIENRDFRNITFLVTIIIDDYKVVPNLTKEPFGEYLFLYVMESLKRYDDNQYEFGRLFDFPDTSPAELFNSGVSGDPLGNPNAAPTLPAITQFRGFQLFHTIDMQNVPDANTLQFDNTRFLLGDFFKVRNDGLLGRIFAIDKPGALMVTSTNPFHSASEHVIDRPSTILGISTKENQVKLKNTGFSIVHIPSLAAVGAYTVLGVHTGIRPLDDVVWFEEGGGLGVYQKIANLLSFGKMADLINDNDQRHVSYKLIEGGQLKNENVDMRLQFIRPSQIRRNNALGVTEVNILNNQLPNENVIDYRSEQISKNILHNRYGGNFIPKFKDVLFFKNDKLQMAWGLYDVTWNDADHNWNEFDIHNPEIKTMPFSRRLFDLNTKFDTKIEGFGVIKNHYHHKVSSTNPSLLVLDEPKFPSVGEIAIDRIDYNIFSSDFDAKFYKDYTEKVISSKIFGYFNSGDEKSYLGTKLVQLEESIILSGFEDISEDVGIDDPDFDLEGRELVFERRGNTILFRISLEKTLTEYLFSNVRDKFMKFVNEFNTFYGNFEESVRAYVANNIVDLYRITNITPFIRRFNEDQNVPLIINQPNELTLIEQGYRRDKNISTTNINNLEVVLKYTTREEFLYSFNLRFQIEK